MVNFYKNLRTSEFLRPKTFQILSIKNSFDYDKKDFIYTAIQIFLPIMLTQSMLTGKLVSTTNQSTKLSSAAGIVLTACYQTAFSTHFFFLNLQIARAHACRLNKNLMTLDHPVNTGVILTFDPSYLVWSIIVY